MAILGRPPLSMQENFALLNREQRAQRGEQRDIAQQPLDDELTRARIESAQRPRTSAQPKVEYDPDTGEPFTIGFDPQTGQPFRRPLGPPPPPQPAQPATPPLSGGESPFPGLGLDIVGGAGTPPITPPSAGSSFGDFVGPPEPAGLGGSAPQQTVPSPEEALTQYQALRQQFDQQGRVDQVAIIDGIIERIQTYIQPQGSPSGQQGSLAKGLLSPPGEQFDQTGPPAQQAPEQLGDFLSPGKAPVVTFNKDTRQPNVTPPEQAQTVRDQTATSQDPEEKARLGVAQKWGTLDDKTKKAIQGALKNGWTWIQISQADGVK